MADLALRPKVIALFEEVNKLIKKVNMELSVQEESLARPLLSTNEIPYPKLIIKDHNTINRRGEFSTRLVIPAKSFTATLPKISDLG